RAGATESKQRKVARVMTAAKADHTDCTSHLVIGNPQDRRGSLIDIQAERLADLSDNCLLYIIQRYPAVHRQQTVRIESAKHKIGIRDRRPRATTTVADRTRPGAGAFRSDLQHPRLADEGDRPAARADGMHIYHRDMDRHRIFELKFR